MRIEESIIWNWSSDGLSTALVAGVVIGKGGWLVVLGEAGVAAS